MSEVQALQSGHLQREAILRTASGEARLEPNSYVRFYQQDHPTPWLRGSELRVSPQGIGVHLDTPDHTWEDWVVPWEDIQRVEISSPSGARTTAVLAITALSLAAIAAVATLDLGIAAMTRGRGNFPISEAVGRALFSASWRHVVLLAPTQYEEKPAPALYPSALPPPPRLMTAVQRRQRLLSATMLPADPEIPLQPLFTPLLRRRALIRGIAFADGGIELHHLHDRAPSAGVTAGMRIWDLFELAGGLRYLVSPLAAKSARDGLSVSGHWGTQQTEEPGTGQHFSLLAYFRFNLHLELDPRRRVALLLGNDLGGGPSIESYWRVLFGLRVRVTETFSLSAYLFNPTVTHFRDGTDLAPTSGWTFPSHLEAGFAF